MEIESNTNDKSNTKSKELVLPKAKKVQPKKNISKAKSVNAKTKPVTNQKQPQKQKQTRNYPVVTVEKSLIIAQKLKEKNGGNPWSPKDVKEVIEVRDTNKFFYITQASRDFGFTTGTRDAKEIALTEFVVRLFMHQI